MSFGIGTNVKWNQESKYCGALDASVVQFGLSCRPAPVVRLPDCPLIANDCLRLPQPQQQRTTRDIFTNANRNHLLHRLVKQFCGRLKLVGISSNIFLHRYILATYFGSHYIKENNSILISIFSMTSFGTTLYQYTVYVFLLDSICYFSRFILNE